MIAVDTVPGNELHTLGFFAVVQQQTVSLVAITASFAHKGVDLCPLLRCDFEHHNINLLSVFSGSKKAAECDPDGSMTAFCILNGGNG